MIDTTHESVISLSEAARRLPKFNGKSPHPSSVWRWCKTGIDGIKLEHIKVGRRTCTSIEALDRFFNRDSNSGEASNDIPQKDTVPDRIQAISERLSNEGI